MLCVPLSDLLILVLLTDLLPLLLRLHGLLFIELRELVGVTPCRPRHQQYDEHGQRAHDQYTPNLMLMPVKPSENLTDASVVASSEHLTGDSGASGCRFSPGLSLGRPGDCRS